MTGPYKGRPTSRDLYLIFRTRPSFWCVPVLVLVVLDEPCTGVQRQGGCVRARDLEIAGARAEGGGPASQLAQDPRAVALPPGLRVDLDRRHAEPAPPV